MSHLYCAFHGLTRFHRCPSPQVKQGRILSTIFDPPSSYLFCLFSSQLSFCCMCVYYSIPYCSSIIVSDFSVFLCVQSCYSLCPPNTITKSIITHLPPTTGLSFNLKKSKNYISSCTLYFLWVVNHCSKSNFLTKLILVSLRKSPNLFTDWEKQINNTQTWPAPISRTNFVTTRKLLIEAVLLT